MRFIIILSLLLFTLKNHAQEVSLKAEVSFDTVYLGNYFELKFTLENARADIAEPDLSDFDIGFRS